jgi:tetratricopeptide (TPR) repeat protein
MSANTHSRMAELLHRFESGWQPDALDRLPGLLHNLPAEEREAAARAVLLVDLERRYGVGLDPYPPSLYARLTGETYWGAVAVAVAVADRRWREVLELDCPAGRYAELLPTDSPAPQECPSGDDLLRVWPLAPGTTFGRYQIVGSLGRGQMGRVYLAADAVLLRQVALKVPAVVAPRQSARFLREMRAMAQVHHPQVCAVYDAGRAGGVPYFTMYHVPGARPLTHAFRPPLPPQQAVRLMAEVAAGVAAAHRLGVVHRDLKPANVLADADGRVFVTDFGLAVTTPDPRLTTDGEVVGTPAYMAPEQAAGRVQPTDPRVDVYALGVMLYELVCGRLPHPGSTSREVFAALRDPAYQPQLPDTFDIQLRDITARALARDPAGRFGSASELADALNGWLAGASAPVPPPPPVGYDPRVAAEVQRELAAWGWEEGLARLADSPDPVARDRRRMTAGWLRGELGDDEAAERAFAAAPPELHRWAAIGRAFLAVRRHHLEAAGRWLDAAAAGADEPALRAAAHHLRGAIEYKAGRDPRGHLADALDALPRGHFTAGRVLDTLAADAAARGQHASAAEFFEHALRLKREHADPLGEAVTLGQRGRWHLDAGRWAEADADLRAGVAVAQRVGDRRGLAQGYNHRGQVALARDDAATAEVLLGESVRLAREGGWQIPEGYARKDLAAVRVVQGRWQEAEEELTAAERLFRAAEFAEGLAHVRWVRGRLHSARFGPADAVDHLRAAADRFDQLNEPLLSATCRFQLADALRRADVSPVVVGQTLADAHAAAERANAGELVERIARTWAAVAPADYLNATNHRAERAGVSHAAVLVVSVRPADGGTDPAVALAYLHEWWGELVGVCPDELTDSAGERLVFAFAGPDGVSRAAAAAARMAERAVLRSRPRRAVGWPVWEVRAGVASGRLGVGRVGTTRQGGRVAVGEAVRRADELLATTRPERPRVAVGPADPPPVGAGWHPAGGHPSLGELWEWHQPEPR